jgi:catechol 2,3-dioxygenase-like lactoylglutathione lyase family enzyme
LAVAPRLDHIGIIVRDTSATASFLTSVMGFRMHTLGWALDPATPQSGGVKLGFMEGHGIWFTFIEPTSDGPTMDELGVRGDGAISELDFDVANLDAAIDRFESAGVGIVNMDGKPFPPGQRGWTLEKFGLRLVYLDPKGSHGIPIEVYQRGPESTDILHLRDRTWRDQPKPAVGMPKFSHVTIAVRDVDATAEFFSRAMNIGSPVSGDASSRLVIAADGAKCRLVYAHGVSIELVQPPVGSTAMAAVLARGDGQPAELVYEVPDLGSFAALARHQNQGIPTPSMRPIEDRTIGCTAVGRRGGFIAMPLDLTHGMRLTVVGAVAPH